MNDYNTIEELVLKILKNKNKENTKFSFKLNYDEK